MYGVLRFYKGKFLLRLYEDIIGKYSKCIEVVSVEEAKEYCLDNGYEFVYRGA